MKHKIKVAIVAFLMSFTILIAPASPASADSYGNRVNNSAGSVGNVRVYGDVRYQYPNGQYYVARGYVWVAPNQNSWSAGKMIDAKSFVAPLGCTTFKVSGGKWYVQRAGYTHLVSQTWGVNTTLVLYC